jgi:YceI-like domain
VVRVFKGLGIAVLSLALAACAAQRPRPTLPQAASPPSASLQSLPAAGDYPIDSTRSELRVLVYRAGPLANLGHNHVLVNRSISGSLHLAQNLASSSFSLSMPVADFVVDDAKARRQEGSDFPGEIPQDAKEGTEHNMLSPALLNAAEFPTIAVKSVTITGDQGQPSASLLITIAGRESTIVAPFTLHGDARHLTAAGTFELRQTAIGLKPYSLFGGALQVQDAMQLKLSIVASVN